MKYKIIMSGGANIPADLNTDQLENLKRLMNSDKTSLYSLSSGTLIAPRHIVAIEPVKVA